MIKTRKPVILLLSVALDFTILPFGTAKASETSFVNIDSTFAAKNRAYSLT